MYAEERENENPTDGLKFDCTQSRHLVTVPDRVLAHKHNPVSVQINIDPALTRLQRLINPPSVTTENNRHQRLTPSYDYDYDRIGCAPAQSQSQMRPRGPHVG